jgi:alpha-beta hydrolase superfamily lysophospholipase
MLHGLESHSAWFTHSASYIASLGHPVYGMERRGSGHSAAPRGMCRDYRELLDDINALANRVLSNHGTDRFHLFGHCFGAIPATAYACTYPRRLKSLLLATPALYTIAEPPLIGKLKVLWAAITGSKIKIPVALEAEWFTDQPEFLDSIRNDEMTLHEAGARLYWETARARRFIHKRENELSMPVYMALAGKDRICDNVRDREFFNRVPANTKICSTFPEAVHILEFSSEKYPFFNSLEEWFAKNAEPGTEDT